MYSCESVKGTEWFSKRCHVTRCLARRVGVQIRRKHRRYPRATQICFLMFQRLLGDPRRRVERSTAGRGSIAEQRCGRPISFSPGLSFFFPFFSPFLKIIFFLRIDAPFGIVHNVLVDIFQKLINNNKKKNPLVLAEQFMKGSFYSWRIITSTSAGAAATGL